jgi:hypothetical protein
VTFLAATGDSGAPSGFPAFSPNVVAVGGTTLTLNPNNSYNSESGWSGGGGSISAFEAKPGFQSALPYAFRANPDVAFDADPNSGVAVYDTYDDGAATPWDQVGGTSLASPCWAGLIAIVNQVRVGVGDAILDGTSQTLPLLYSLPAADFHDITAGNNGNAAGAGYDLITGIGSPRAPLIVRDLAPLQIVVTPSSIASPVEGIASTGIQVASFKDSTGQQPVVSYSAGIVWGDGQASAGTIVDLLNGTYGVVGTHTYADEGSYTISVSVHSSTSGLIGQTSTTQSVADAPLTPQPNPFTVGERTVYSGIVGSFTDANVNAPQSDFSALIAWGDGRVTPGTIVSTGGGGFSVSGNHLFSDEGSYTVSVTVTDVGGSKTTIVSPATVPDAPLASTPQTFNSVAGTAGTAIVASFTDSAGLDPVVDYSVSITWGDGSPATTLQNGASLLNRGTRYDIQASHLYKSAGTFPIAVTVTDVGGANTTAASTANIADAPLSAFPTAFTSTEGKAFTGQIATFTSSNTFATAASFNPPQVDWGDGSPIDSTATIVDMGGGKFAINGTHVYAEEGSDSVAVNITSKGGSTGQTLGTALVLDAPISVTAQDQSAVAGASISGTIATFVDTYALGQTAEFTASIDWGDGTVTTGVISQPGGAGTPFLVTDSHAYAQAQSYDISVTVSEPGGATSTSTATAVISDAPFTVSTVQIPDQSEGGTYSGTVGTFTSANPLAVASGFIASIDWGDGGTTGGQLTAVGNGSFNVSSLTPHTFGEEGTYTVTLKVISLGGARDSASSQLTVKDAPIIGVPAAPLQTVAGTPFSGVVGSFSEYSLAPLSDFIDTTIDWGDGQTSPGTISAGPDGTFVVSGSITYHSAGNFIPRITVTDVGGSVGTFTVGATVADPPIAITSNAISAVQGFPFHGTVASFTEPNVYAKASEFQAQITWGDGKQGTGVVSGGGGQFTVTASHTFAVASNGMSFSVTGLHGGGSNATSFSSAHVLVPLSGAMLRASDSGMSNTDGITNVTRPIFTGRGEPGSTISIFAAPTSNPSATTQVGHGGTDSSGNWAVQISPLGAGSYRITASMTDSRTSQTVQTVPLPATPSGGPLIIATTGPTVSSVSLNPQLGQLHIVFQTSLASMNLAGLVNPANYELALPAGLGLQPFSATGLVASPGPNGQLSVTISYNLGRKAAAGGYVVILHAAGLTDLAGNILNEHHFVTFPQASNSPNPDYVAQIDVSRSLTASAPHVYVSLAEQLAAYNYAKNAQQKKTVRLPKAQRANVVTTSVPKPSTVRKK